MNFHITSYVKSPSYVWSRFMYFILPSFAGWVDQNSFLIMIFYSLLQSSDSGSRSTLSAA